MVPEDMLFFVDNPKFHTENAADIIRFQLNDTHHSDRPYIMPTEEFRLIDGLSGIPILTKEEEINLFLKYNYARYLYNNHPLPPNPNLLNIAIDTRNELIMRNLRIVSFAAQKFRGRMSVDVFNNGPMHLFKAISKFDIDKGYRFSTYATVTLINRFIRDHQTESKRIYTIQDVQIPTSHNKRGFSLFDFYATESDYTDNIVISNDEIDMCVGIVDLLPQLESAVLKMRLGLKPYSKPHSLQEIGAALTITREKARQLEVLALNRTRHILGRNYGCST